MINGNHDIQGRLCGVLPYDFRWPSLAKIVRRIWHPGGPMWVPKIFGAGWTLNLAHRGSQLLLAAFFGFGVAAILFA
jgi:Family of unknown function (DUF5808)